MAVDQIPHRDQPHYCRECGARFERAPDIWRQQSAHGEEYFHELRQHPDIVDRVYVRCSRSCEKREQYEEAKARRRLYGKGVEDIPVDPTAYDRLFPE
jgi:hypothetical protein